MATEAGVNEDILGDGVRDTAPGRRARLLELRLGRRTLAVLAFIRDWNGLVLSAVFGLISGLIFARTNDFLRPTFDDSYITLTFARNVAEHGMLSFDGQHWSTGATSPLHVMILAGLLKAGAAPLFSSIAVGFASHMVLCAAVWWLTLSIFHSRIAALLGGLAIAFTSYAALDVMNGLESGLFMALVTLTVASYLSWRGRRGRIATGLLLGLCIFTRPEGAFLLPALVLYRWVERPRGEPLRAYVKDALSIALPACAALGVLTGYSLIVNGSFSGTATVKMHFFQEYKFTLREKVTIASDNVGVFLGPLITLLALASLVVRRRETVLVTLFWAPVVVVYTLLFPGSLYHYFYRYQHPILPFVAAFAAGGAYQLLMVAATRDLVTKVMVVGAMVIVVVPLWQHYDRWRDISEQSVAEQKTDLEAMAKELNMLVLPDQTLATHDIGAIGYFADYKVVDLVGLVNPEVVPYHDGRRLREYVDEKDPDFLLFFPEWDHDFLGIDPNHFKDRYQWVAEFKGGAIRKYSYVLWRVIHTKDRPWYPGEQLEEEHAFDPYFYYAPPAPLPPPPPQAATPQRR